MILYVLCFFAVAAIYLIKKAYVHFHQNRQTYNQVYQNASWDIIRDYCLLETRTFLSHLLDTGFLYSVSSTSYGLTYYDGPTKYIVLFPKRRGPCPFSSVTNFIVGETVTSEIDVTDHIRMIAGPSYNFHGIPTTPEMLGYEKLLFRFRNGTEAGFLSQNIITFPK